MKKNIKERIKEEYLEVSLDRKGVVALVKKINDFESEEEFIDHVYDTFGEASLQIVHELANALEEEGYSAEEIENNLSVADVDFEVNKLLNFPVEVDLYFEFYNDGNLDMSKDSYGWLRWLAQSQGYRFKDFKDWIDGKGALPSGKFPKSVSEELSENTGAMNALTALAKMSVQDYYRLKNHHGTVKDIVLPKEVNLGLFNPWHGSGSMFGIELEKNIKIKPKNLLGIGALHKSPLGYSPNEVYGLVPEAWDNFVEVNTKKRL